MGSHEKTWNRADGIGLNISKGLLQAAELGTHYREKGENQGHKQEVTQTAKIQARGDGVLDYSIYGMLARSGWIPDIRTWNRENARATDDSEVWGFVK